jgi:hypothetical protein
MQRDLLTFCLKPLQVPQNAWLQNVERLVHDKPKKYLKGGDHDLNALLSRNLPGGTEETT